MGFLDHLFGTSKLDHMPLKWDMHNHILFGIDDGSKNIEYSLDMAKSFIDLGFERIIATPHIMSDYYPNNRAVIEDKKNQLELALAENHLNLKIMIEARNLKEIKEILQITDCRLQIADFKLKFLSLSPTRTERRMRSTNDEKI